MRRGPVAYWKTNEGAEAVPPAAAQEWLDIIESVSPTLDVRLVSREDGRWWVSSAQETLPGIGGAPPPIYH